MLFLSEEEKKKKAQRLPLRPFTEHNTVTEWQSRPIHVSFLNLLMNVLIVGCDWIFPSPSQPAAPQAGKAGSRCVQLARSAHLAAEFLATPVTLNMACHLGALSMAQLTFKQFPQFTRGPRGWKALGQGFLSSALLTFGAG